MDFVTWIVIGAVVALIAGIAQSVIASNMQKEMESNLKSLPDFSPTQQVMGCDGTSGLAIDEARKKICLIAHSGAAVARRVISYKDIVSVELFEDGTSITKTVRSSQIGGVIVGGLLLGGVGAIIGGLSGKTETSGKVKRIDLRLVVNDTSAPLHDVAFMNTEGNEGGIVYRHAIHQARHWHGLVEVLIKRADAEERSSQVSERVTAPALPAASVADEIKKLADLQNNGLLTSDEFQQQKAKVLGANRQLAENLATNDAPAYIGPSKKIKVRKHVLLGDPDAALRSNSIGALNKVLQGVPLEEILFRSYALIFAAAIKYGKEPFRTLDRLVELGVNLEATSQIVAKDEQLGLKDEWGTVLEHAIYLDKEDAALAACRSCVDDMSDSGHGNPVGR